MYGMLLIQLVLNLVGDNVDNMKTKLSYERITYGEKNGKSKNLH